MKKQSLLGFALALGITSAAGAQQLPAQINNGQPVTLKVWDSFTTGETAPQIYKAFMAKYPNVTIRREAIAFDQIRQTVKTALGSGTGPDVVYYDAGPGYAGVLAQSNLILPLDRYATRYGWRRSIARTALAGTTINGKIYGVPLEVDLIGVYYNKTLMDKAGLKLPKTTSQLITFCKQAVEKGYIPMAFGNNPGWQAYHQFSMASNNLVGITGMQNLLLQQKGSWNTPEVVKAIKTYFVDLREAGCFPSTVNALTNNDLRVLFTTGKALMFPTGSWMAGGIAEAAEKNKWDIDMAPFPSIAGGKGSYFVTGVGSAWYVSQKSENPDAAAAFIQFTISQDAAKMWAELDGNFLPVKMDTTDLKVPPLLRSIANHLQSAIAGKIRLGQNIDVVAPPEFNNEMRNGFQAVLAGTKTPAQQAADLQKAWEAGIANMKKQP